MQDFADIPFYTQNPLNSVEEPLVQHIVNQIGQRNKSYTRIGSKGTLLLFLIIFCILIMKIFPYSSGWYPLFGGTQLTVLCAFLFAAFLVICVQIVRACNF